MQPKKPLASESFILLSGEIGRSLRENILSGSVSLRPKGQPDVVLLANWDLCPAAQGPTVRLHYQWRSESASYAVRLDASDCFSGLRTKVRWRFVCPRCDQRADKLYLPIRAGHQQYFLCRLCWGIDYLSHVRPKRASVHAMQRLGHKIEIIEAELVKLRRSHSRLLQSRGPH